MEGQRLESITESLLSDGGMEFAFVIFFPSFFIFSTDIKKLRRKREIWTAVRTCAFKPPVCSQSLKCTASSAYPGGIT